jgi:sulfofructose kinase
MSWRAGAAIDLGQTLRGPADPDIVAGRAVSRTAQTPARLRRPPVVPKPVLVVGHCALDRVYRIEAFPARPTKVSARDHREDGGGAAANAAAAIARLGGRVALWSRAGDDETGDKARRLLVQAGVDIDAVRSFPGAKTPTAAVIVDAKGERLVVSEDDHVLPMDVDWLPIAQVAGAGAVLSDLSWLEGTLALFAEARRHGVPTVLDIDLAGCALFERFAPLTDYAIFSAPAFETSVPGTDDAARFAAVRAMGPRHAGVTRGGAGYVWSGAGGDGRHAGFEVPVVDTTGAGDAFHGAFTLALAAGLDEAACARVAAATAALKCRRLGARLGLPTAVELDAFLVEQIGKGLAEALLPEGGLMTS